MPLSGQVTGNYLKRKSDLRPADCLMRRNSERFQSPVGSGLVIIATPLENRCREEIAMPALDKSGKGRHCMFAAGILILPVLGIPRHTSMGGEELLS